MAIVTRVGKGSKLTIEEMDNNLLSLETDISGNVYAITSKLDKGSYTGTAKDLENAIIANVSAITSKLDKGSYTGTAKDLENAIVAAVTGASGISIVPTSPAPSGTGIASFTATQAGTYTNYGGVVVNANSFAVISRSATGVFSISQTALVISNKTLTSSVTLPTEIPDFKGQIGIFSDGSNETFFIARSLSSSNKWEKIYNDYVISQYSTTNQLLKGSNFFKVLTSSVISPTETPDFKGQVAVFTDTNSIDHYFVARSLTAATKWERLITQSILMYSLTALTVAPSFKGQIGVFNGNYYLAVSLTGTMWVLLQNENNGLAVLTSSATAPTETPLYKGQIGVFVDGANETYFVARSLTAATKWDKIYNTFSLLSYLTTNGYIKNSEVLAVITSSSTNPTETPLYKGQLGQFTSTSGISTYFIARSLTSSTQKWELVFTQSNVDTLNTKSAAVNDNFVNTLQIISTAAEIYTHNSYIKIVNDVVFIIYMSNETDDFEGGTNQFIKMVSFNLYLPSVKTYHSIAVAGDTIVGGGTISGDISAPNLLIKSDGNFRTFFRYNGVIYYRDFNVTTFAKGTINQVNCTIRNQATVVSLTYANANLHFEYLFGTGIAGIAQDFFFTSDIITNAGKFYGAVSFGGGLGTTTTSILIESSDEGLTWKMWGAPNPTLLPGVTGTANKYMWEGALIFDATNVYMYCRSVVNGMQMVKAPISNFFDFGTTIASFTQVSTTGNAKPSIIDYPLVGILLFSEGNSTTAIPSTSLSNRTNTDVILINATHTTFTKKYSLRDYMGLHSFSLFLFNTELYVSLSTGLRKKTVKNVSEIQLGRLPKRLFL
jgi:hypothetical protein